MRIGHIPACVIGIFILLAVFSQAHGGVIVGAGTQFALNDGQLAVPGAVTVTGTLTVGTGEIILGGDWTQNGTFNSGTGTVTFSGANQSIFGDSIFHNLTKVVSSASTLTFEGGKKTTVTNTLHLEGKSGQLLSLKSDSAAQWKIDPQGTRTIQYLNVRDSWNVNATKIDAVGKNCVDSGNNTNWKFSAVTPNNYYVNVTTGDDSNDGSATHPWQTLHHAISEINAGTSGVYTLHVAPGTYGVSARAFEGEKDDQMILTQNNVRITGDQSNPPIVVGTNAQNWTKGVEVKGSNNIIENLFVTGFSDDSEEGIRITDGNGNEILHCRVYGNNFGIRLMDAADTTIRNCEVSLNTTHGIDIVLSPETDVFDNKIYDNPQFGIRAQASPEISRNLIYDNDYGILVEVLNGNTASPTIKNNAIYEETAGAMRYGIYTRAQNGSTINALIYHNTMDGGALNGITTENDNNSTSVPLIKYNIIVNFDQYGILNDGAAPTIDYNDVWNNTAGNYEGCQKGAHDINKDPQFASYSLWKYSPCINTIPSTARDPVILDYPGFTRPRPGETAKDMGAYEYVGDVSDPFTMPGGTGQTTDYRIFTVPFYMTGAEMLADMEKVLGTYNNTTWRCFAMVDGAYVEFNETAFKNLSIIPGMGFWIITLLTDTIPFKGEIAPDGINYEITLTPGWHLIGLPWVSRNIDLGNILVTDGLNRYAITSAQNNLTQRVLWDYTGTGPYSGYEKRDVSTYELQCGTAYFIKVLSTQNVTLIIPHQNTRVPSIERGSTGDEEEPPPPPGAAQSQGCPEFVNGRLEGNVTFPTNKNCSYQGASSYTLGPGVMIPEGAIVTIKPE